MESLRSRLSASHSCSAATSGSTTAMIDLARQFVSEHGGSVDCLDEDSTIVLAASYKRDAACAATLKQVRFSSLLGSLSLAFGLIFGEKWPIRSTHA